eukprot:gb/GECG01011807.1/.p1 GENE.gb/GECG01011807.1/~~gb/GECG01011807.1/.p1  ORF type:complete len:149 (+),score=23.27 gb/GECG01011807.1/:1-447(+)
MLNGNPHNTCGISCRVTLKRARDEEKVDFWGALKTSEQLSEEMLEMQAQAGQREGEMQTEIRGLQTRQNEQDEILRRVSRQLACIFGEASPELRYSNASSSPVNLENTSLVTVLAEVVPNESAAHAWLESLQNMETKQLALERIRDDH